MTQVIEQSFDARAAKVKATVSAFEGKAPKKNVKVAEGLLSADELKENISIDLKSACRQVDSMRNATAKSPGLDVGWGEFIQQKWGLSPDADGKPSSFYETLGVNPSFHSMEMLSTMPEFNENFRWLIPEVIREAVRLGLRTAPMYTKLIISDTFVAQPTVYMPQINMSDVPLAEMNEIESTPTGMLSFGQKTVKLTKIGTGIKVTDEVNQYVSLDVLSIFLQDVGVRLGLKMDAMASKVLINGDQADGSTAAATIGVTNTTNGFQYYDLLRAWLRMGRIGRTPSYILSDEGPALDILSLPEFKGFAGQTTVPQQLILDSPIPTVQRYLINGNINSANKIMLIDTTRALIKFTSAALRVEGDRIVDKGINATYVHTTTGFANVLRDSRLIMDKSIAFSGNGFPAWMDVSAYQLANQ